MSLRRFLAVIALLGVLVHAAAIPRHNAMLLGVTLKQIAETAALAAVGVPAEASQGVICRANSGGTAPGAPSGSSLCPICIGGAPAHALPASPPLIVLALRFEPLEPVAHRDMRRVQLRLYRPPARGPPLVLI
jgi:hypothetical protein